MKLVDYCPTRGIMYENHDLTKGRYPMGRAEKSQPERKTKLVRVQDRGQITLPAEIRRKYDIKEGDLVGFRETDEGLLIDLRAVQVAKALDQMGAGLREKGITLEEMIESGREIREELLKEMYPNLAKSTET